MKGRNAQVFAVVRRIPRGRVATYGQVASLCGLDGLPRQVGYALHALPAGSSVPWHRVVNARGEISLRSQPGSELTQRLLLEAEGVVFDARGRIRLTDFQWTPTSRRTTAARAPESEIAALKAARRRRA